MNVFGIAAVVVFAVLMFLLNRWLRRSEREGHFDPDGSSPVSKPGLRLLFDYSKHGWRNDGSRQPPIE